MVAVGGVTESIVDVNRFEEFARGEIWCVKFGEFTSVNKSSLMNVRSQVAFELGNSLTR